MSRFGTAVCLAIAALLAGGCVSTVNERRMQEMRRQTEFDRMTAAVSRIEERVEALSVAQQGIYEEIEALKTAAKDDRAKTAADLQRLAEQIKAGEAALEAARRDIVDFLSKRMAEIMRRPGQGRFETGVEHAVQAGETLSQIAAAYGVTVEAVVKANGLKNPDAIRAGQVLFIPQ